ncbi:hypothetical protein OSB04_028504 [Centaurea solstitialis]|uniref:CCHC-type domain-containing protein n=1 Tax=Centaurea solstitialis TaxID=347529 RepID=A0AA38SN94_9ASTR|nr:hypothetical protein OSB04_028504 [Centaurea solstitialis]
MQGGDKALEGQKENAMNAYESFCAREGETLTETYNRLNICVNDLRRLGLEKNKYEVNVKFLKRLNKYEVMPHEETLFGKTEKKIDPPTLALMSNRGSSSHENYTVEEPVVLDDGLTKEEMFQLENSFALMAKFRGNPQRFNRFRQGPQFVGGQSNQGGYQSRESYQRNDQGRTNNYQQRDSSGYNNQGSYQDRRQGYNNNQQQQRDQDYNSNNYHGNRGYQGGSYNQRWNDQSGSNNNNQNQKTNDEGHQYNNTGGTEPPQKNKLPALEAPPVANQNRNPARVPTCYNCGDPGHYASDCKKKLKDSAYFEKKAAMMKKKEQGKVLLADEEDWVMEPEDPDDEGPSAVQGHCLMADFEEPCISGSPNDSTDEEAELSSRDSKEIISIGSETRPPVLVVGEYQQWKRRMINFLDLLDDKLMVSIIEGPIRPTVTVAEVARTDVTPHLPAYEVKKPYDMFSHEQRARAAIDKRALTLLTMALPNDMFARVDSCKDARAMWLGIEHQMQGGDKALEGQKENAMNAYESFCAREGETLTETYNRLNICVNDLRRLGLEKNKYEVNVKFLKRLNKYEVMPHEETLFGKTEKKIDPPTLALMSNRGSSSHENYTVEEPVVLDDGLTKEEMFQLENSFALMAKFRGNPQRFNRFRQGPQFVGGQSNQGGYQSRESYQRNDQGRTNNYQQRDSSGYNNQGSYQDRRQGYNNNQQQQRDQDYNSNNYHGNRGYQGGSYNQRWNDQSGSNNNNQNQKTNDEGHQYNNTGGTEPPQKNKLPALEAPPVANQNRNPARVPTCYNCGDPGHYASDCKKKLKDSAYFEKKAAMMKKKEQGKVLLADEEDWVMEPEDPDDEGPSAVQGHCLMADFEEPCISGSPNDSTDEEAELSSRDSKEIISIGSETRPPVLVVGEYQQWKRRMINFLDLLDDKLMVSIIEGPIRPTVTVAEVARTDVTPHLPAYEVKKPYDMFSHEQRARAAIDKRALTLLTMALPNDMFARVDSCKDARAMWLGIEHQMQGGDKALEGQKENAMNAYESFCAREGETLTETYNRLNICVNDLRRLGLEKNKYEVNVKFLKRLNKYEVMPHEETLFGKTEKKIDPPTLALMSNRGSSSHENYTVEEPVVLDDGLTKEEMFQLENSFALMAKFRGNPQRFNRFRQGPQFVGGQSNQGGYQSRESYQRNDQGRTNNYQQRDSSGYNNQGSYQDRRQGYNNNQQQQRDQDYNSNNYHGNRGYQGGSYNQRWNDQSGSNNNNQNQKTNDEGHQYNNTGGTEPPQKNKLPALEAPPVANQNRNPARVPTCYNCGDPGHYASDCKKKLKDSAYFEKKAAMMKKKEQGKVLLADEEDWVMEPEDPDDEGPSAVQGHCLMADFEEPCISGSPNDSTDEEAELSSRDSKEIISIGSETRPPVLVVGEYQQWKRRMINFLDLLDDKLMVSIIEGPIRPTVTVAEVARTDVTPHLPAYEVKKPYDMFSHEQRARAAIDKRALTLLTMALPNDMFARVDSCKDARAMWLGIEHQMQGGDKALEGQKENAMNAYESFCAREGETLTETYNRLNICVNDLRRLGLEKNKYEVNVKFLKRLNKYEVMPHEETLFGKTEKKIDPPTLALMSNRGSSSHENYTVEEPVVLDDGLTKEEMFQLENSFALMAKFRGNPQRFNRFRQGPQFVGGQSNQGGYQSRESYQRNDQGRTNNYQQRDSSGYNNQGSYQDRRQGYNNNQQQQRDQDYNSNNYHGNRGYQGGSYNQRWNDQSGSNNNNQNQKTNDEGHQYNNTGGTEPPQKNKLPALEAPPVANQNRNPARVPTCYNCGDPGHYASDCKKKLKDSAYFEKKAAMMKKKEQGKVLLADEEDWVMEPEDPDDEGPSAVQGHCLMADFEEPCISGSPNDSTDEEAELSSRDLKEIISIGSETRPPVLVVGEYQQWKRRMINFLDLLDDKLMVSIIEGPIRPTVTVAEVARTDVTPHLPAYEVKKPYHMFSHEQRARAAIDKRALTLLTMALPNDMFARVDSCKDARAMWLGIEHQMQGGDKAVEGQKENAMNAYESFCAREGETLTETYNRLNICVNDLRRLGLEKNKYEVNVKFLKRLNKYEVMPHEETLFGKTEKKIDPPTLALMSNRGSSSHENYTVEEPVVLDDGLTKEEMFQLENSFALMAKFRGNPQRFNRFRQGPQFVGGQSNQGGYQSRESYQRNDQGRTNNYQQRDSSGYNNQGSYQDRRQGYNNNQQQQRDQDYNSNNYHGNRGYQGGSYNQRWNDQSGSNNNNQNQKTNDEGHQYNNTGGTEPPQKNKLPALEAPPVANQNRNPARVPTCYNCGDPGHYASDCKKKLKDSAYFEKKAAMMKKKEQGKVLLADEEDWVMEPEDPDDEGPSAVQGHCLMADFEEPCISGSPNDSTDEEAELSSRDLKEIISIGSETRPPVLVVGEYQQWKRRMINFLDLLDDKLMVSIIEGPIRPTVTVAEVARTDVTPHLPAYEVKKPYHMFSHEQRARAAIDKRALTLLTMALPNDMFARVDSCKDARAMWLGIEHQMQGGDKAVEGQKENAMNAYESFCAREGETLTETYNRLKHLCERFTETRTGKEQIRGECEIPQKIEQIRGDAS